MSIWGKIIGGAAGFAVGGPLGALIGGLAGHAVDLLQEDAAGPRDGTQEIAFTIGVIVLSAKMAKVDGRVTGDEVAAFRRLFQVPADEVKNVAFVFDRAKADAAGFEPYASQIARLFPPAAPVLEQLLGALFQIALADHRLLPEEEAYLAAVAGIFGFNADAIARIRETWAGPNEADPYRVLGVARTASDAEIKGAWRKLAAENHPDRQVAAGMPVEFIRSATDRLARINDAHDRIEKLRQRDREKVGAV